MVILLSTLGKRTLPGQADREELPGWSSSGPEGKRSSSVLDLGPNTKVGPESGPERGPDPGPNRRRPGEE